MTASALVTLYTDGACSGNPGPGGWGCILIYGDTKRKLSGYENHTTNNRMELMAVIKGLESLTRSVEVKIITDSQYVKNAFTQGWLKSWKKNNWKTSTKEDVKNKDLWLVLSSLVENHNVSWEWVKGHSGNKYNDICDTIAREAIKLKSGIDERVS
ncbi:MAG: ribonuclease HI [Bdellovibrionota bacterium]